MTTRRQALGTFAGLAIAGCATRPAPADRLTVATFNIWHDMGAWPARLPLLVQALRDADADVIALQEVLEDADKGLPNQAQTLAQALGGYSVAFCSTDAQGARRRYGNAILSRLPVVETDWRALDPREDYRTALRVRVLVGGRPVDVVNTHLAWQADAAAVRARQIADLLAWLPPRGTAPLLVMGDFNAEQSDPGLAALTGPRFTSALPAGSAATTLNTARNHPPRVIDHVFVEADHFAPLSAGLLGLQATNGEYPSDHFGVVARLALSGTRRRRSRA